MTTQAGSSRMLYFSFFLLFVYFSQIALHLPSIIGAGVLLSYIAIGIYSFGSFLFSRNKPAFLFVAALLILFLTANWLISDKEVSSTHLGHIPSSAMLKNSITTLFSLFTGYIAARHSHGNPKQEKIITIWLAFTCLLQFFIVFFVFSPLLGESNIFVNNSAYCFVTLLPYIFLISDTERRSAAILTIFAFIFLLLCYKRGALLCFFIAVAYKAILYLKTSENKMKAAVRCALFITSCLLLLAIQLEIDPIASGRLLQTLEGSTSGRDVIYGKILDSYAYETDDAILLFGNGLSQSINITGNYAHSDWFELLADTGIAGVVTYALFFVTYIFFISRNGHRFPDNDRRTMNLIILLLFIKSSYSMGFIAIFNSFDMLLLGFLAGRDTDSRTLQ